jgi:peroxiredoxin Q/BCP
MKLSIGDKAPDFRLADQDGVMYALGDYKGKWVLLYFYPKDDTPGCTKEACAMRDTMPKFRKTGLQVFGVSVDTMKSHKKFQEKFGLNFPLLADERKEVVEAYGVWGEKKFMGRKYMGINRVSFLIDPAGKIAKIYDKVKPEMHAEEVAGDVVALS